MAHNNTREKAPHWLQQNRYIPHNTTKYYLLILFLIITAVLFAQGTLRVSVDKNESGILKDNKELDTFKIFIESTYSQNSSDFTFTSENKNCQLKPGYYNLIFSIDENKTVTICEVLIRDSEFTLIRLLIEPEVKMKKSEYRKRKKLYDNFKRNKCV